MLLLPNVNSSLQYVPDSTQNVSFHVSYVDWASGSGTPGGDAQVLSSVSLAGNTVVAAPASGVVRNIKQFVLCNFQGSGLTVTMNVLVSGNPVAVVKRYVPGGYSLCYEDGLGWYLFGGDGTSRNNRSVSSQALTASVANAIAGSALPFTNLKAGTVFNWQVIMSKTGAGLASQTFDVRTGSSGNASDTARVSGFATGTQTAVADTAEVNFCVTVQSVSNVSGIIVASMDMKHNLASTGFAPTPNVEQFFSSVGFNNAQVSGQSDQISLVTTPGASAVVTVQQVTAQRIDP